MNEYLHLITDPAHTAVELTYIMVDLLILGAVKRAIVRHLHRDLRNRDRRHKHARLTIHGLPVGTRVRARLTGKVYVKMSDRWYVETLGGHTPALADPDQDRAGFDILPHRTGV